MRPYPAMPTTSGPQGSQPVYPAYPSYPTTPNGPPPGLYSPWAPQPLRPPPPQATGNTQGAPSTSNLVTAPSMGSESVTLVRIRMNDDYRIDPPIPVSAALVSGGVRPNGSGADISGQPNGALQSPGTIPSLERERAMLSDTESANPVQQFFDKAQHIKFQTENVATFVDMGFQPEQAALAWAYVRDAKLSEADVPDFASNLGELTGMGFTLAQASGALVMRKNDKRAASELCLAVAQN